MSAGATQRYVRYSPQNIPTAGETFILPRRFVSDIQRARHFSKLKPRSVIVSFGSIRRRYDAPAISKCQSSYYLRRCLRLHIIEGVGRLMPLRQCHLLVPPRSAVFLVPSLPPACQQKASPDISQRLALTKFLKTGWRCFGRYLMMLSAMRAPSAGRCFALMLASYGSTVGFIAAGGAGMLDITALMLEVATAVIFARH